MTHPNDASGFRPRLGSPLWLYLAAVTTAGLGALAVVLAGLPMAGLVRLLGQRLLWVVAGLALLGELRPAVSREKSHPDSGTAALAFCFAALLYWGFPIAAALRSITTVVAAMLGRRALLGAAFDAAQGTLSLAAAGLVLAYAGIHPRPLTPWVPGGGQLLAVGGAALAYFAVNFVLAGVAAALHARAPVAAMLRKTLP